MFGLISGLYKSLTEKQQLNLLIIGLDSAGKTTLHERIKQQHTKHKPLPLEKITPTIGLNVTSVQLSSYQLTLWDLGGELHLRPIWTDYYPSTHAILFVIDASRGVQHRIKEINDELQRLNEDSSLQNVPMAILLNVRSESNNTNAENDPSSSNTSTAENPPPKDSSSTVGDQSLTPDQLIIKYSKALNMDPLKEKRKIFMHVVNAATGSGINACFNSLLKELEQNARLIDNSDHV